MMLRRDLEVVWCAETSACPDEWTPEVPSRGQCAVTALIVQDVCGSDLFRVNVDGESHYFGYLYPGNQLVDLTADQFDDVPDYANGVRRTRDYVLSFPDTERRYLLLKELLGKHWWE